MVQLFRKLFPSIFIISVTSILFGDTLFPGKDEIIYGGDVLTQFYYWKGFLVDSIRSGIIPFWNPYNFSGTPFLAHPSTAAFYPFTIIFFLLPLNSAFSWYYFLHFLIAGLGIYYLVKKESGVFGATASAIILLLSGFLSSRVYAGHVDILSSIVWIPWVFHFAKNFIDDGRGKSALLLIVFLALQILASYQAVFIFTIELIAILCVWRLYCVCRYERLHLSIYTKRVILLSVSVGISLSMTSLSWIPTYQLVSQSIRSGGLSYLLASWGSLPIAGISLFFHPFDKQLLSQLSYGFGNSSFSNFFIYYFGWVPLLIIFSAFIIETLFRKQISEIGFFILSVPFFLFVSFGSYLPVNIHFFLYQIFPPYRFLRIPDQHLIMVVFLIAYLTGLLVGRMTYKIPKLLIVLILFVQLFSFSKRLIYLTKIPDVSFDLSLIEKLKGSESLTRVFMDYRVAAPLHEQLEFNAASKYGIYSAGGYDPVILKNYYQFINSINRSTDLASVLSQYNIEIPPANQNSSSIDFLNVGYLLLATGYNPEGFDKLRYRQLYQNNGITLYENQAVLPRYFFVYDVNVFHNDEQTLMQLAQSQINLATTVAISDSGGMKNPIHSECKSRSIPQIITSNVNEVILHTSNPCNAVLSTSDVYYPGWKAEIDGKGSELLKSNASFRAMFVPSGDHTVRLYYSPAIYYIAGLISLTGLIVYGILIRLIFISRRRR